MLKSKKEQTRIDPINGVYFATYLYSIQGVGLDEVVRILPVDPYVEDVFLKESRS